MKELSVFVDESGDFGEYEKHAPYYIITMILHDQSVDISAEIGKLNEALKNMGYGNEQAIHTEPLIRREDPYRYFQPNERRAIFSKLFYFTFGCDIKYKSFVYRKSEYENIFKLEARMARDLSQFIRDNLTYFQSFSKVILYYDNGQHELNRILNTVFATQLVDYDVRKVIPNEYRLFQAADLICTLELLRVKTEHQGFEINRDGGNFMVSFPKEKSEIWEEYISAHLEFEYWNEYVTENGAVFLFHLQDGIKRYEVNGFLNDEVLGLCERLCECKFESIKRMLSDNHFYKRFIG